MDARPRPDLSAAAESATGVGMPISSDAPQRRRTARRERDASRPPTIKDVARVAGVGIGTASRALGTGELVSPATRERVQAAAARVGYRPSRAAKVLRGVPARIIGVLVPDLSLPLYGEVLRGAGEAARRHDYLLLVCDGQNSRAVIEEQAERLYREQIDGLVVAGPFLALPRLQRFVESGIPIAPEPRSVPGAKRTVNEPRAASERRATRDAYRRLVELGHRRIAFVAHTERDSQALPSMQRLRADLLREALAEVGARFDESLLLAADGVEAARARVAELLARPVDASPTAIVAGTEALTPAVLASLAEARRAIPDEISVLGFGDSIWEQAYRPSISVVRFDYFAAGAALIENLVARIERAATVPPLPAFASEFVERESLGPAPRDAARARRRT
jgi:LacI family transcriptional regulator